jgi:flagellar biosynthesis/type III secretory pathway protein FliH
MKKIVPAVVPLLLLLFFTVPSNADIYKYIDENGQKRWTDDLSQVPVDQRNSAERMETEETFATPPPDAEDGNAAPEPSATTEEEISDTDEPNREALEKEKAALKIKYEELLQEREEIEKATAEAKAQGKRLEESMRKRITAYNDMVEAYEKRLTVYNGNVAQFNQRIESATKSE